MIEKPIDPNVPVFPGKPLSEEQKRLYGLFDEIRKGQLTFIDEAGKRIIELCTALLGILFGVTAFGETFPPPYLKANPNNQYLLLVVLAFLVLALLAGVLTVQPRTYADYEANLTEMRRTLTEIMAYKRRWMQVATWSLCIGIVALALLVARLVTGG